MQITITQPDLGPQKSYTTAQVVAAAILTYVENNEDFASGDRVLFGAYGQEKTEIVTLTGVTSSNQIDHSTGPTFDHPARTPIYQLLFDQAEIYRATSSGGTYALVTTTDLNVDETYTIYNDTGGTTSSWYKIRYKNSVTGAYSDYSDVMQGTGFTEDSLGSMTNEVLENFGDPDAKEVKRYQVKAQLNAGVRRLVMQIIKLYPDYFGAYTTQALTSGTYSYPTQFIAFKRINIGSSATDSYRAIFKNEMDLDPTLTYTEYGSYVFLRDTSWGTYPDCNGKIAYLYYWQYPEAMSNDTDEHGLPYGGRDVLVLYALYRVWLNKDTDKALIVKIELDERIKEYLDFVGQSRQTSGFSESDEDY
jgi:hypothetical protein